MRSAVLDHAADQSPGPRVHFLNRTPAVTAANTPVCTIVVDAEEDFDWAHPQEGVQHTSANMLHIRLLQEIAGAYGARPAYLLTYPILQSAEIVKLLRTRVERGDCEVGVQLHPWVTPPFSKGRGLATSFAGSLPPELERLKLLELRRKFIECFGTTPLMYRAGRYGLGENSARLLEELGFSIDTSVAPRTDFAATGGPDFSDYGSAPFWFGQRDRLLEVPLCRDVVGWSGRFAPALYQSLSQPRLAPLHILALATRLRAVERITLSPEGNDLPAMKRLVRSLHAAGSRVFVVSLHSSSLTVGRNPYVRSEYDLRHLYDRLSGILDFMLREFSMRFSSLSRLPSLLQPPA